MALFGKKKTEEKLEEKKEEKTSDVKPARNASQIEAGGPAKKTEKKIEKKEEKKEKKETGTEISRIAKDIILEPWITEKSHVQMAMNKYIFRVRPEADKKEIRNAVQVMYNVKVIDINIINIPSKKRTYGRFVGRKSGYKKAIITLKEGDKIELFKGV